MSFVRNPRGAVRRHCLVAKVPIDWIEQLHGLLVRPDWVDDQREQSQAGEEEHTLGQSHVGAELTPVGEDDPPHIVGEHHPAVEGVDHHPLVGLPKQGVRPASLEERRSESIHVLKVYHIHTHTHIYKVIFNHLSFRGHSCVFTKGNTLVNSCKSRRKTPHIGKEVEVEGFM